MKRSLLGVAVFVLLGTAATARADLLFFDAKQKTAFGPSYPTAPVTFDVAAGQLMQGPPIRPVEHFGLSLFNAFIPQEPFMPLSMGLQARDNGSADIEPRGFGTNGFVDFLPQEPTFPAQSFFDVFIDLNRSSMTGPPIRMTNGPPIIPVDPTRSFFDVFFDIAVEGTGTAQHQLHFAIGDMQPLLFSNVFVDRVDFDPSFHVNFGLDNQGGDLADGPLYTMTSSGDFTAVPEPASLTLCGLGCLLLAGGWLRSNLRASKSCPNATA